MDCVFLPQFFVVSRGKHTTRVVQRQSSSRGARTGQSLVIGKTKRAAQSHTHAMVEQGGRIYCHQGSPGQDESEEIGIERESLKLLEWHALCEQVSRFASTPMGLQLCKEGRIPFGKNPEECEALLEQTASACLLPSPLDFSGIVDVSETLRSASAGIVLSVNELCVVEKMLSSTRRVYEQLRSCSSRASTTHQIGDDMKGSFPLNISEELHNGHHAFSPLLSIMTDTNFCTSLVQVLNLSLDGASLSILDTASPALAALRALRRENMKNLETLLLETGEKVVSAGGMDSVIITTRRARQCIAVRASHKHLLPGGVILDFSNSGATVFMEPKAALELNNKEVELASRGKTEEFLILERLTQKLADCSSHVWTLLERITFLDVVCAKAGHAHWLQSVRPFFNRKIIFPDEEGKQSGEVCNETSNSFSVHIEGLSHPLLLGQALVGSGKQDINFPVPVDFKVKVGIRVIVISGPNTGGKTASMKTFGLSVLMAKAGLFVPARGKAVLPWFDKVLADIGDSQSLEQSLSTFSGHIRQARRIMETASCQSLVLFDEIGSGTDPSEGAALATAILEHMADHVYLTIVTTHFSKLSSFREGRFEVASVEFDIETLRPKYKVLWSIAGQSNALDIASSLGVDESILARARHWMRKLAPENQEQRATQLMDPLVEQRKILKSQAEITTRALFDTKTLYDELAAEADGLETRVGALRMQQEDKLRRDIDAAKSSMEEIVSIFEGSSRSLDKSVMAMSIGEALAAIASVVENYLKTFRKPEKPNVDLEVAGRLAVGDSVLIKRLGKTPVIVIEAPTQSDESFLVQLGGLKLRAKLSEVAKVLQKDKGEAVLQRMKRSGEAPFYK